MSQEWFYTKDGKTKVGPVSSADLTALAKSGRLLPSDNLWKEGMSQWMPASTIKGLFGYSGGMSRPLPEPIQSNALHRSGGESRSVVTMLSRMSLGLAVFLSLSAGVVALSRVGGEALSPIVAGLAILLGLAAAGLGLAAHNGGAFLGSAATAVFLATSALLFSIGSAVGAKVIDEGRAAKAILFEVEEERRRTEIARREASQYKDEAERARDAATEQPKDLLSKVKEQRAALEDDKTKIENDKDALRKDREAILKETKEVADQRKAVEDERKESQKMIRSLDERAVDIAKKENQLALDMKKPAELERAAAEQRKKAEDAENRSNKVLADAEQKKQEAAKKEQEAKQHYKKVIDAYEELRKQLKSKESKDRKAAIDTIRQIGQLPAAATVTLRDIHRDLCEIAVQDPKLRQDAQNALHELDGELGPLVAKLIRPPKDAAFEDYIKAIQELPKHGPAGLPLMEALLKSGFPTTAKIDPQQAWGILTADVEALAEVAKDEKQGVEILLTATKSSRALAILKRAPAQAVELRRLVGGHLLTLGTAKPQVRQSVAAYFVHEMLKSTDTENRKAACEALESFGADAVNALDPLRKMQLADPSDEVRTAARKAVKKIEESKAK